MFRLLIWKKKRRKPARRFVPIRVPTHTATSRVGRERASRGDLVQCRVRDGIQNRLDLGAWPLAFGAGRRRKPGPVERFSGIIGRYCRTRCPASAPQPPPPLGRRRLADAKKDTWARSSSGRPAVMQLSHIDLMENDVLTGQIINQLREQERKKNERKKGKKKEQQRDVTYFGFNPRRVRTVRTSISRTDRGGKEGDGFEGDTT